MTFGSTPPKNAPSTSMNPDTVHLMALNDQVSQLINWATAVQATVRVLLAKRIGAPEVAPVGPLSAMTTPQAASPSPVVTPVVTPVVAPMAVPAVRFGMPPSADNEPSKASFLRQTRDLGIPDSVVAGPNYLNHPHRPSNEGFAKTQALIDKVKEMKAAGEDPSTLWPNT